MSLRDNYTTAVLGALQSGLETEAALKGLKRILTAKGHGKLYPAILNSLCMKLEGQETQPVISVIVRSEDTLKKQKSAIDNELKKMKLDGEFVVRVDPTITGGFIIRTKDTLLDASYKSKLLGIYRKLA